MKLRNLFVALALALTALAGAYVASRTEAPATPVSALVLPAPNPVPAFALLDQRGDSVDERVFEGHWDLVFFGFTHCPDICPATLQVLATAKKTLADNGQQVLPRIVLVSVDPERDTPEILAEYVGYFGEGNLGLTGTLDEIRKLTDGLGIYFEKQTATDGSYAVDHSAAVLLIDPDGGFHSLFSAPHLVDNYVHDLPLLIGGR